MNPPNNPYLQSEANSHANLDKGRTKGITKSKVNHASLPALIQTFMEGSTAREAAESIGISRSVINRFIKSLRTPPYRCLYISHYESYKGYPAPVYIIGAERDTQAPAKIPAKVRAKRWRDKQRDLKILSALHTPPKEY